MGTHPPVGRKVPPEGPASVLGAGEWAPPAAQALIRARRPLRPERKASTPPPFRRLVADETLRIELGPDVVAALALENLDLSTAATSEAVRRFIVEHRAG
jgi:hypothetical protein